jgi:cyclic nucleotide gated channel
MAKDLSMRESFPSMGSDDSDGEEEDPLPKKNVSLKMMAGKIMAGNRKGLHAIKELPTLKKPDEPDFSAEPYD